MMDVLSVEVLRGPQGTLFGKNAQAGAILRSHPSESPLNGKRFGDNENLTRLEAYGLWNLNLGLEKGNYEANFFIKNVFDKDYETQAYYYSTFQNYVSTPGLPRRLGIIMKYFF